MATKAAAKLAAAPRPPKPITSAEAAELRRLLDRKRKRALNTYERPEIDKKAIIAQVRKDNPEVEAAYKLRDKIEAMVQKAQADGVPLVPRYSYTRERFMAVNTDKIDEAIRAAEDAANETYRVYVTGVHKAYEDAEDAISMARLDASVRAADIIAAFEAAL